MSKNNRVPLALDTISNIGADLIHTHVIIDARKILMTSTSCKEHNGEFDPRLKSLDFIHRKINSNFFKASVLEIKPNNCC